MTTKCADFLKEVKSKFRSFTSAYAGYGDNSRTYFGNEKNRRNSLYLQCSSRQCGPCEVWVCNA